MNLQALRQTSQDRATSLGQLPEPANLHLGAGYLAAGGHDIAAAAVMRQLRNALCGIVLDRPNHPLPSWLGWT